MPRHHIYQITQFWWLSRLLPLRAGLVERAEDWRWGSLYRRIHGTAEERVLLADSPVPLGRLWRRHVNERQNEAELEAIRRCATIWRGLVALQSRAATGPGIHVPSPRATKKATDINQLGRTQK